MPADAPSIYWDSCVLLSYIEGIPGRVEVLDPLFERATKGEMTLVTSEITRVEVAFLGSEKLGSDDPEEAEMEIAELWKPASPITPLEFHEGISDDARQLLRKARARELSLKPMDAIHIASAAFIGAREMHTYDSKLPRFSEDSGVPIMEPQTTQEQLRPASAYRHDD